MKALKGVMVYVGIVLCIFFTLAILLFSLMYFMPDFRIFGVGVVHADTQITGTPIVISDYENITDIELNVGGKKIDTTIVVSDEATNVDYHLRYNVFGIAYDLTEYSVIKSVEASGSLLKINFNVSEPNGMISVTGGSGFYITMPSSYTYNLFIKTTSGNILLGDGNTNFNINNLTVVTSSGSLITDINTDYTFNSLNLTTGSGKMDFGNITNLSVANPIKMSANSGKIVFNNLNGSLDITGDGVEVIANTITCNNSGFKFISKNGFFNIKELSTPAGAENSIVTENCNIKIDKISGRTGIISTYGNISLGEIADYCILESNHGNINVTNALDDITIVTEFGNITVNSYLKNGKFTSKKGNINVRNTGDYIQGVYTKIENKDGNVTVENRVNRLIVKTTGSGYVEVTFKEIKGGLNETDVFQHKINISDYGSALVYMPTDNYNTPYMFKAKGEITGEISGLFNKYAGDEVLSSDEYQFFPSASEDNKALCKKSCFFEFLGKIQFKGFLTNI